MITRRQILKKMVTGTTIAATGFAAPFILRGNSAFALAPGKNTLPLPPLDKGTIKDGVRTYDLTLQRGESQFLPGIKTPTLGVNGDYLGPTLKMTDGEKIRLNVTNTIGEPTTLHWHGLHLPARADGGPHQVIEPGQTWSPEWTVKQSAATFWYHPHLIHKTGLHAYLGMAGGIIVEDANSAKLDLPNTYGIDDLPLVLQDKRFGRDGTMHYTSSMHDRMNGLKGNVLLVNGAVSPHFTATTQRLRLRFVNGSNARFYTLGFDDGRSFKIIAGDGSLLPAPVDATRLVVSPGERAEIIVDVSALTTDQTITLKSFGYSSGGSGRGMGMMMGVDNDQFDVLNITAAANLRPSPKIPEQLVQIERLKMTNATVARQFKLNMVMGPQVMMGIIKNPLTINGKAMDIDRIDERVKLGATEIWQIENTSMMAHPFHIHDIQFQILERNGNPPPAHEMGLKDTVLVRPDETVRIIAKFEDYADSNRPYMYHCHILDHEDWGMMGQFVVEA